MDFDKKTIGWVVFGHYSDQLHTTCIDTCHDPDLDDPCLSPLVSFLISWHDKTWYLRPVNQSPKI